MGKFTSIALLALFLGGCGGPMYGAARVELAYRGNSKLAVATHDQRQEVLSSDREPSFVGISRGMVGDPWEVHTDSKEPLAVEMSRAICGSLAQGGFDASPLALSYSASAAEVKRKLAQAGSQITLLLTLHQWTYDGYWSTGITFGMTLAVLDREGNVLATAEQSGEETLNQSSPKFFAQKLALLMNDPGVAGALGAAP